MLLVSPSEKRLRIVHKVVARGPFICKRNYRIRPWVASEGGRRLRGCTATRDFREDCRGPGDSPADGEEADGSSVLG